MDLPLLGRPLLWYGLLFALGFLAGHQMLRYVLKKTSLPLPAGVMADKLSLSVVVGGLIGARLIDIACYQGIQELWRHPLSLFSIWEGGLASHGGAIGIVIALWICSKRHHFSFLTSLDLITLPVAIAAVFIRAGNFINQEILGTPSQLPWAVVFMHPADGSAMVPRHPAQLYEAVAYLCIFLALFYFLRKGALEKRGKLIGLFLTLVFTARVLIEGVKVEQSVYIPPSHPLTMGQYLSIPWVLLGITLFTRARPQQERQALNARSSLDIHDQTADRS
jgi:prolipoprotein diacylglyceryl transferase